MENAAEVIEAYIKESHFDDNTGNNFDKAANDNVDDDINCADNNFNNTSINILDMCTGTGCIIITLAKELEENLKSQRNLMIVKSPVMQMNQNRHLICISSPQTLIQIH